MRARPAGGRRHRFRRSPHLVGYWTSEGFVLQNFVSGRRVAAGPLAVELLGFCEDWTTRDQLAAQFPQHTAALLERAIRVLIRCTLLDRSDQPVVRSLETWAPWNPAAGFFHFSTKDVAFATDTDG